MAKIVQKEWDDHGKEIGKELPPLCAKEARKVAITTLRESGIDRTQQEVMAKHMGHNVTTADRYYDKSKKREARGQLMTELNKQYKVRIVHKLLGYFLCYSFSPVIVISILLSRLLQAGTRNVAPLSQPAVVE